MMRSFAVMAVTAVALAVSAGAAVTSVAVQGMAPMSEGGFEMKQTTVDYGDLNISNQQGATKLLARIDKAAAASCATDAMPSFKVKTEVKQCRTQAVSQAIAKVHSSELTKVAKAD